MASEKKGCFSKFLKHLGISRAIRKVESADPDTYDKVLEILSSDEEDEDLSLISERSLLKNIVSISNKRAEDIMTPRVDVVAVDVETSISDLVTIFKKEHFSRIPVYKDNLDHVVGFLHVKDLLTILSNPEKEIVLSDLLRKVLFISPYMKIFDLFLEMQVKRAHFAIVVDEFGGVDGLVTFEDIMEEIVGEIDDEYDKEPPVNKIVQKDTNTIETYGRIEISDLEEHIGEFATSEEKEECNTLAGLIVFLAGYIPSKKELIKHTSGVEFEILSADAVKINKVLVHYSELLSVKEEYN